MENETENNIVEIGGRLASEIELSHEVFDEKFYKFYIETNRLSDLSDKLPIIISERVTNLNELNEGDILHISGQFRSYNEPTETGKSRLVLSIFTKKTSLKSYLFFMIESNVLFLYKVKSFLLILFFSHISTAVFIYSTSKFLDLKIIPPLFIWALLYMYDFTPFFF